MKFEVLSQVIFEGELHTVVEVFSLPGKGYRHCIQRGVVTQEQLNDQLKQGFLHGCCHSFKELVRA